MRAFAIAMGAAAITGCGTLLGMDERALERVGGADAAVEVTLASCPFDGDGLGDVAERGCWETVDFAEIAAGERVGSAEGVTFDGRYMYFAPMPGAVVLRYDTTAPLAAKTSWSSFDVKKELGFLPRFSGAIFDGRFITLVPRTSSPLVVRYDTTLAFDRGASWDMFDPTKIHSEAVGFAGAAYDGTYVYLVPRDGPIVIRHDARADAGTGWETFDLSTMKLGVLASFWGAVFDGRRLTLAPEGDGVAVSFDTSGSFTSAASWSKFDTSAFHSSGLSFLGGAFDGRYVYLGPGGSDSVVARYDSQATFSSSASWSVFDMGVLTPSLGLFQGTAYDGRFVYFAPVGITNGARNRRLGRYDTTKSFTAESSWTIVDTSLADAGPFSSTAFDGRFVYFAPAGGTTLARFAARAAPLAPSLPAFFGSFF